MFDNEAYLHFVSEKAIVGVVEFNQGAKINFDFTSKEKRKT